MHSLMPDYDDQLQEMAQYIADAQISKELLDSWFKSVENELKEHARLGKTTYMLKHVPNIAKLCAKAHDVALAHPNADRALSILAEEINKYCMLFEELWVNHSDVELSISLLVGRELILTNGGSGLRMVFNWTPTAEEAKQKKLKIAN